MCVCVCVCVCYVTWSIYIGMGSFGFCHGEMPNTSDYCLTDALGRLFYAFSQTSTVYGNEGFLFYLKGLHSESCCDPHTHAYVLSQSDAVHTFTLMS